MSYPKGQCRYCKESHDLLNCKDCSFLGADLHHVVKLFKVRGTLSARNLCSYLFQIALDGVPKSHIVYHSKTSSVSQRNFPLAQ